MRERRSPCTKYYVYTSTRNVYVACAFEFIQSFVFSFSCLYYYKCTERDFFLSVFFFQYFFFVYFSFSLFHLFSRFNNSLFCFSCHTFIYLCEKKTHSHNLTQYHCQWFRFSNRASITRGFFFSFAICETKTEYFFFGFCLVFFLVFLFLENRKSLKNGLNFTDTRTHVCCSDRWWNQGTKR